MTNHTAATRYARALLDVAVKEAERGLAVGRERDLGAPDARASDALQEIEQQLGAFVDLFKQHPTLERVLLNPAVPVPRKHAVVTELTAQLGVSTALSKLLVLLADRDRLVLLPELLSTYRERLLDYQHIVRAEVTTAAPLMAGRAQAIERRLSQVTGRQMTVTTSVDPSIIGGVVARIGSTIYDGSITRQLQKMKEKLVERV